MSTAGRWSREPGTEGSRLGGEFVLLDASGRMLRGLNPAAARLWEWLETPRTDEELAGLLAAHYGIPLAQALADTRAFLEACAARALVRRPP